ncbi:alpha/beta hydrolase family protein [Streptomyces sp. NPDC054932]
MDQQVVDVHRLNLKDDPQLLSPPRLAEPYQCATTVIVFDFLPHADVDIEVAGAVVLSQMVGFPQPVGATLTLPAPLTAGQVVRARQRQGGRTSDWSPPVSARDHTLDYPAGPPRPQINPAPVYECGSRTGVGNLLAGGNVWITADGAEVGRADGCAPQQGVNIDPAYSLNQHVRAHFELCHDESPPSVEQVVQPGPNPLPAPGFDPVYEGGEQLPVTGIANGARVSLSRGGTPVGIYRCWGGTLFVSLSPPFTAGETFSASQQLCASSPPSPPGNGTVQPCSALPAPGVGPVQAGDQAVTITSSAPGAQIKVYLNGVQVGLGSAPYVWLSKMVTAGDTVVVVQSLPPACPGSLATQTAVACVDPPFTYDPSALDLFPVGSDEYTAGPVHGSVHYPADDDGPTQSFNARLAGTGRTPIVFMAHGNHSPSDPSYLGYDYFQDTLARMGIIAVSVDCNALNGPTGGLGNIEARADLIIDSIRHFQSLDADPASRFFGRIDFTRLGLMGHSRGGDAVVTVPSVLPAIGVTIRAVLALAPSNFRYFYGMPTIRPDGYAFMTILPAADGDLDENYGAQFYDQAKPGPYKSQQYVHSTNHNYFNRQWALDDGVTPVVSRGDHERILDVYGSALFRSRLLGHPTHVFLDGRQRPTGALTALVQQSFAYEGSTTVDDHEDANGIGTNSLGLPTTQSGGMVADEFPFDQVTGAFNQSFFGLSVGMVMQPQKNGAIFRSALQAMDLRGLEVWLRTAEVAQGALPPDSTGFLLGLEDSQGTTAWVDSDSVGGVPRPYQRPSMTKTMLKTLRFRPECFRVAEPQLRLDRIQAILIQYNRQGPRALSFDDLQLVKPL